MGSGESFAAARVPLGNMVVRSRLEHMALVQVTPCESDLHVLAYALVPGLDCDSSVDFDGFDVADHQRKKVNG
jgi:hypothetical protein